MKPASCPIAIIGLSGAFAQSANLGEYWENILLEVDSITDVPESQWSVDDYFDPDPRAADKTYCKRGGFLPEIDFNPMEFGLPPNILEITDISQILSLVFAKQALADAGYGESNPLAETTGVVLGASSLKQITPLASRLQYPIWKRVLRASAVPEDEIDSIIEKMKLAYVSWQEDSFPGYLSNIVSGRIANRLDLAGINCTLDAACASSMAALQMAMYELQSHNSDMMITGGVDTNNSIMAFVSFSKTPAFTATDHMRPFDAESDGMLIGEGLGLLVLKRLEDAERDDDRIYAVIHGLGASSDGRSKSIYAPRGEGQELSVRRALANSGFPPSTIGLVEAHGTGTPAGDPTEVSALSRVFGEDNELGQCIALGSVKSQIGHTKVAAGAASLIKAALALHHKVLPATINVENPHPKLELSKSPFYLNTSTRPWFSQSPRRAGVSSFGFGGTNFHAVLEEYTAKKSPSRRLHSTPYAILLQAPDEVGLTAICREAVDRLGRSDGASAFRSLVEASNSIVIPDHAARLGFVAKSPGEAVSLLESALQALRASPGADVFSHPHGIHYRRRGVPSQGKVVALFSGQGSQYLEMGKSLSINFPIIHETFAEMDGALAHRGFLPITDTVFPQPVFEEAERQAQEERLSQTEHSQAAIGAFSLGLYRLFRQAGFRPDFAAGHSLGELTALCAAGALSETDFMTLLHERGQAMAQKPDRSFDSGTMLAVSGDADALQPLIAGHSGVTIANINSASQFVAAGTRDELDALKADLASAGTGATFLPVSAAFHSRRVQHAQAPFAQALERVAFSRPRVPVYSNSTGSAYPEAPEAARQTLADHIVNPVQFRREIETIHEDGGAIFVEFGPRNILTRLVGSILEGKPHQAVALNPSKSKDSDQQLRDAYVQLRVIGLDLASIDPDQKAPDAHVERPRSTFRLTGNAFVGSKTRADFEEVLKAGKQSRRDTTAPPLAHQNETDNREFLLEQKMNRSQEMNLSEQRSLTNADLGGDPHQTYLHNMSDYSEKYFSLMQQLYGLINNANLNPRALEVFERGMMQFHEQQSMAQQVHELYLSGESGAGKTRRSSTQKSRHLLAVSSDRDTEAPYTSASDAPRSEPGPEMHPEPPASIALAASAPRTAQPRVEIRDAPPATTLPISDPIGESADAAEQEPHPVRPAADVATVPDEEGTEIILLTVISDKTGYPLDTLDANMDLEADLGIDSIKRVEIMAALEGKLVGNLSNLNFERFAELRTVSQIAEFLDASKKKTSVN